MIERTVVLPCPLGRAFALFTQEASTWWPPERRHTGDPASAIVLLASGRFYERATDGREVELGRVRAWEEPSRLLLDFYPGTDAEHPTEVEVTFTPASADAGQTRVTVVHRATPASEALFGARVARYVASWELLLPALARAAAGALADR